MPTGYTAAITKDMPLETFVWMCARAFGALITMRDDLMDVPIPTRLQPSGYHRDKVAEARIRLAEVRSWTPEQSLADMDATIALSDAGRERYAADRRDKKAAYEQMLSQVLAWQPPSPDHVELKNFMVQQITESIRFDCTEHPEPVRDSHTADSWKEYRLAQAEKDAAYHAKEWAAEMKRTNDRNEWIEQLRDSLAAKATA